MDYKERIRKLLALAKSPEENEAKAALLKARRLIAEHKLTEEEFNEEKKRVVKKIITGCTFSMRRDPWLNDLAVVIGENYCCQAFYRYTKGKKTYTVGFMGLEEDVAMCVPIFQYAADCILSRNGRVKKKLNGYPAGYINSLCNGYGYGFVSGLRKAFEQQNTENAEGWGLVLVMPKEVTDAVNGLQKKELYPRAAAQIEQGEYQKGFADSKKFDPKKRIEDMDRRDQ